MSSIRRQTCLASAGILVVMAGITLVAPQAEADDGDTALICAVPSGLFAEWARDLSKARGGLLTTIVGGAAVTYGCTKTLKALDGGDSGVFNVQTPSGSTITQRLSRNDLLVSVPTYNYAAPRSVQCAGWTIPSFFAACLDYELDPL